MFEKLGKIKDNVLEKTDKFTKIMLLLGAFSVPIVSEAQNSSEIKPTNQENIELAKGYLKNIITEVKKQNENVKPTLTGENIYIGEINNQKVILARDNSWVITCSEDGKKGYVDLDVDGKIDRLVIIENMATNNLNEELNKRIAEKGGKVDDEMNSQLDDQHKLLNQANYGRKSIESLKDEAKELRPFNLMDVKVIDFDGNVVNLIDIGSGESHEYEGEYAQKKEDQAQETYTVLLGGLDKGITK